MVVSHNRVNSFNFPQSLIWKCNSKMLIPVLLLNMSVSGLLQKVTQKCLNAFVQPSSQCQMYFVAHS